MSVQVRELISRVSFHPMSDGLASGRVHRITLQALIGPVADLGSGGPGAGDAHPLGVQFLFQFHTVFGKFWQKLHVGTPEGLAPPPRGNPGSATVISSKVCIGIPSAPII